MSSYLCGLSRMWLFSGYSYELTRPSCLILVCPNIPLLILWDFSNVVSVQNLAPARSGYGLWCWISGVLFSWVVCYWIPYLFPYHWIGDLALLGARDGCSTSSCHTVSVDAPVDSPWGELCLRRVYSSVSAQHLKRRDVLLLKWLTCSMDVVY